MGSVPSFIKKGKTRKPLVYARRKDVAADKFEGLSGPIESRHMLISALLPPAVKAFLADCDKEVESLCGERYRHLQSRDNHRWGSAPGSIVLANQRVALEVPRVRAKSGQEVPLQTYQDFQNPELFDQAVFVEGIKRVSQRDYEKGVSKLANSFGFKKGSITKKWIKTTAKKLAELQERDLRPMDIRAVFIDGKRFRSHGVIIALGVAVNGRKFVLGIYEASGEDHLSCLNLLNDLEKRGLATSGLMFIVDGGSGLNKALNMKYDCDNKKRRRAIRLRCHVHKWRNIEKALGDSSHKALGLFWAIRDAKNMAEAKVISDRLESVLRDLNQSALDSYLEAKDDLLAIHEIKLSHSLKRFFSTTNPIENLNSLIEEDMRRVKRWQDSGHFQRWLATYCLNSEKRMRRIRGHASLPGVWVLLRTLTDHKQEVIDSQEEVA